MSKMQEPPKSSRKEKSMTARKPCRPAAARPSAGYVRGTAAGSRSNAQTMSCKDAQNIGELKDPAVLLHRRLPKICQ